MRAALTCLATAGITLFCSFAAASSPGVTPTTIVIGQSAALSGPAQDLGLEMRQGALAYFSSVNSNGGVHGRSVELVSLDDGYEPPRAVANTEDLIVNKKVFALFGYVGTPTSQAVIPIFTAAQVPYVGAFTGAEILRDPFNRYIFNVRASYYQETERIVEHLVSGGTTRIAVFHQNDAYGAAGLAGVKRAMAKRNLNLTEVATVERNSVDVSEAARILRAATPAAIIQIGAYAACAELIRQLQGVESPTKFFNVSFVGSQSLARELGDVGHGVMISQVVPFPFSGQEPIMREYRNAMRSQGFEQLSFTSMEGFLAAKVMVEGLRRAGPNLTREGFVSAMETIKDHDFGGFRLSYSDTNHNGSDFVELTIIGRGGRFVR